MGCPQAGERRRQQDTEDTNTRREQRHAPTLPPPTQAGQPSAHITTIADSSDVSGSTWPVVSRYARRSYVGPSIIHMHVQQQHIPSTIIYHPIHHYVVFTIHLPAHRFQFLYTKHY